MAFGKSLVIDSRKHPLFFADRSFEFADSLAVFVAGHYPRYEFNEDPTETLEKLYDIGKTLQAAVIRRHDDIVSFLLSRSAVVTDQPHNKLDTVELAIREPVSLTIVRQLPDAGATPCREVFKSISLQRAVRMGREGIIKLIVARGADTQGRSLQEVLESGRQGRINR